VEERRLGVGLGLGAYVIWGLLTVYWKALEGLNPFELIGARVVSSFTLLAVVLGVTHRWSGLAPLRHDRRLLSRVALAAVLLTGNWTSYVWAVVHDNVIETALGYFIAPLGTVLIGVFVFGERLRTAQRVALGLAAVAVVELTLAYGRVPVFALIIATTWSLYGLLKRQGPLAPLESMGGETAVLLAPALLVLAVPMVAGNGLAHEASGYQLGLLALSGLATTVPLLMFAGAAKRVPFTVLGPMQYAVPTINFLLGTFVYHEDLDAGRLFGFGLVWLGLVIFTGDSLRHARQLSVRPRAATVGS
jgi:chloramphenicol-sensitive protein RarD